MWQLIKTSQFIRGAASGIALLTFLSQYLPYAVLDMAALVHQILMRWNTIAARVGAVISGLVGMPDIPPVITNAAIIGLSIGPVWSYTTLKSEWGTHRGLVQNAAFWTSVIIGCMDGFTFCDDRDPRRIWSRSLYRHSKPSHFDFRRSSSPAYIPQGFHLHSGCDVRD